MWKWVYSRKSFVPPVDRLVMLSKLISRQKPLGGQAPSGNALWSRPAPLLWFFNYYGSAWVCGRSFRRCQTSNNCLEFGKNLSISKLVLLTQGQSDPYTTKFSVINKNVFWQTVNFHRRKEPICVIQRSCSWCTVIRRFKTVRVKPDVVTAAACFCDWLKAR